MRSTLPNRLLPFLWHFTKPFTGSFCLMILAVLFTAIYPSFSQYYLKLIIDHVEGATPGSNLFAYDILYCVFWFVALSQIMDSAWRVYDYLILKIIPKIKANVIFEMFDYLQNHSYAYFQRNFAGSLSNKISDMARGTENILILSVEVLFVQLATLVIGACSMAFVHIYFAIAITVWSAFFMGAVLILSKRGHQLSTVFSESRTTAMGKVVDSITNILPIKLFARQRFELKFLQRYLDDTIAKDQHLQSYMLKIKIFQGITATLLVGSMTLLLLYTRQRNLITIGDFTFILNVSINIMQGLWYLASHFVMFSQELGMCSQALTLVQGTHDIQDKPDAQKLVISHGKIEFDQVSFQYHQGRNIFQDKTLVIEGGQKVGLVGYSGSGKTTFVNLILRYFDISGGQILIDGQSVASVTQESLRANIAMIPQDPMLFHRSIMENIRYGRLDATDEQVIEAAKLAHCHEFILKMEEGYATQVGERGIKLSGGQRQRISIARAILKNAPILILDEATSALDSMTEKLIQESIEYLMNKRTSIVIAHRLSTLADMDRILVFEGGQVVEDGSHQVLMEKNGHYANLWNMQAGGFLPDKADEWS